MLLSPARPLSLLVLAGALIPLALLPGIADSPDPLAASRNDSGRAQRQDPRGERGLLLRLVGINSLNGLPIGIIGPFMALWFQLRFGQGPAAIAPVMAAGFLLGAFGALGTGWLTRRLCTVYAVVITRLAGPILLTLLPFTPTYPLAAVCYVLRGACNRGSSGARQAVGLALVGPTRRGLAASINSASMQIPRNLGPLVGGVLLDADFLALPLLLAAIPQATYLALYEITFRNVA